MVKYVIRIIIIIPKNNNNVIIVVVDVVVILFCFWIDISISSFSVETQKVISRYLKTLLLENALFFKCYFVQIAEKTHFLRMLPPGNRGTRSSIL